MSDIYDHPKYRIVPANLKTDHCFCEKCRGGMRYSTYEAPPTFNRTTGAPVRGVALHLWICERWQEGCDRLEFAPVAAPARL